MLTQKSTKTARLKMLLLVPVVAIAAGCFTIKKEAVTPAKFERDGNVITYNGNKVVMSPERRDTVVKYDEENDEEILQVRVFDQVPLTVNGKHIYRMKELTLPASTTTVTGSLEDYILNGLHPFFKALRDGKYTLRLYNIIVNEKGKIIFYQFDHVYGYDDKSEYIRLHTMTQKAISAKVDELVSAAPLLQPAMLNGKEVISFYDDNFYETAIEVRDHVVNYRKEK